jgi:hypothetical protein
MEVDLKNLPDWDLSGRFQAVSNRTSLLLGETENPLALLFYRYVKAFADGWRNTSLSTGLPWRRFSGRLRPILPSPSSTGRFPLRFFQREKTLLFMNAVLYSVKPMPGQRRLRKRAAGHLQ